MEKACPAFAPPTPALLFVLLPSRVAAGFCPSGLERSRHDAWKARQLLCGAFKGAGRPSNKQQTPSRGGSDCGPPTFSCKHHHRNNHHGDMATLSYTFALCSATSPAFPLLHLQSPLRSSPGWGLAINTPILQMRTLELRGGTLGPRAPQPTELQDCNWALDRKHPSLPRKHTALPAPPVPCLSWSGFSHCSCSFFRSADMPRDLTSLLVPGSSVPGPLQACAPNVEDLVPMLEV